MKIPNPIHIIAYDEVTLELVASSKSLLKQTHDPRKLVLH